jgi:Bacterial low temperature requirement A protein (LtrA)
LFVPVFVAWQGFSFYADRFDTDDLAFRLAMFAGMLAISALSVLLPDVVHGHHTAGFALSYVALRTIMLALYARAWRAVPAADQRPRGSGLVKIYAGRAAARYFGVPASDPRHPDVSGVVSVGVVYTGGKGKIAEHGGANPADRDVPILVYAPRAVRAGRYDDSVETTQIAPTIIRLLGLDPDALQAVRIEGTQVLPGTGR